MCYNFAIIKISDRRICYQITEKRASKTGRIYYRNNFSIPISPFFECDRKNQATGIDIILSPGFINYALTTIASVNPAAFSLSRILAAFSGTEYAPTCTRESCFPVPEGVPAIISSFVS